MVFLKKYGVEMIGARAEAIQRGEDREKFKATMEKLAWILVVVGL